MTSIAARVKISRFQVRQAREQSQLTLIFRRLCHRASRRKHTLRIAHRHPGVFPTTSLHYGREADIHCQQAPSPTLPLLLIPAFLVPLFLMLHTAALMQSRQLIRSQT
jgi:hypothetical protein